MGGRNEGNNWRGARTGGEPTNTLIVKSLSFDTTQYSLKEAFETCVDARVSTDRETGRPKGFGFVEFASTEDAKAALDEKNGTEIDGRAVTLDFATPRGADRQNRSFGGGSGGRGEQGGGGRGGRGFTGGEETSTLFVRNLNYATTAESLMDAFEKSVDARILTYRDTGRPKGFGFIDFDSPEDAKAALEEKNGTEVDGRAVTLDYATPQGADRQSGSFGGHGGKGGNWGDRDRDRGRDRGGNRGGGRRGFRGGADY